MARPSRPNKALPSGDVKSFQDALLLLPKKQNHRSREKKASDNGGGTGFVLGEVADDSVPADGYGGLDHYAEAGPSYADASPPDEDGNAQDNYALHAGQDASSGAPNDVVQYEPGYAGAVDALAQYFHPDTLADGRLDADNFQGYVLPVEGHTVVCGVFKNPQSGE